jgi:5-methylcytosine-specific restriction endonuclease McrA
MSSLYLSRLSKDDRKQLEQQLWSQQSGKCFISEEPIDLALEEVDIDHVIPMRDNGKDDPSNFALTLSHYNRSKLAADLRIARVLARFEKIKKTADSDDRGANLNDVLKAFGGGTTEIRMKNRRRICFVCREPKRRLEAGECATARRQTIGVSLLLHYAAD